MWKEEPSNLTQLMEWYNSSTFSHSELVKFYQLSVGMVHVEEDKAIRMEDTVSLVFGRCARLSFPQV